MSKKILWGVGSIVLVAAVISGGHLYADQNLAAYYQKKPIASNIKEFDIQYSHFNMGALKGSADWTLKFTFDACKPKEFIVLKGSDTIERQLQGYKIHSTYKFAEGNPTAKAFLSGTHTAQTRINLLGNTQTQLQFPKITSQIEGLNFRIEPFSIAVDAQARPNSEAKISKLKLLIPAIDIQDSRSRMLTQDISFETNQGLNDEYLEEGKTHFAIASIMRDEANPKLSGGMKNLEVISTTALHDQTVDMDAQFKIGEMNMANSPTTRDVVLNMDIKDVNRQRLQDMLTLVKQLEHSCSPLSESSDDVLQALLSVIDQGFRFESNNNQLSMGNGVAKASLNGKLMPGHHASMQGFMQMVPNLLDFQADVEFDKNLMKGMMNNYLQVAGKSVSDEEVETMFAAMESSGQAKRSGDNMKMAVEYKFGQKRFLND